MRDLTKKQKKILDLHKHIKNVNCYLKDNFDCNAPIIKWSKNQLNLNLY